MNAYIDGRDRSDEMRFGIYVALRILEVPRRHIEAANTIEQMVRQGGRQ